MKKIIAFAVGTVALIGVAVGVQGVGTSGAEEKKDQPPAVSTPATSAAPSDGTKEGDGTREGSTEDHAGKPGENK